MGNLKVIVATIYAAFLWVGVSAAAYAQDVDPDLLDKPTPIENWQVISALVLPLVMAFIIQTNWSRGVQATITMAVSLVWTFVAKTLSDDAIVVPEVIIRGLELFALSIPFYYGIWKPSGIAPRLEAATNVTADAKRAAAVKGL